MILHRPDGDLREFHQRKLRAKGIEATKMVIFFGIWLTVTWWSIGRWWGWGKHVKWWILMEMVFHGIWVVCNWNMNGYGCYPLLMKPNWNSPCLIMFIMYSYGPCLPLPREFGNFCWPSTYITLWYIMTNTLLLNPFIVDLPSENGVFSELCSLTRGYVVVWK